MTRTLVIGGGIAGLAAARFLASDRDVTLLEREPLLATHSSARNAQIWLPVDDDASTGRLARRSAELWTELLGHESAWLRRTGAVALGDEATLVSIGRGASLGGVQARPVTDEALRRLAPEVELSGRSALEIVGAGVFEPSVMMQALASACRDAGVRLQRRAEVVALETRGGRVRGARLADGQTIDADEVVLAAGAWAGALASSVDVCSSLTPLRRHLVVLDVARPSGAIVWSFDPDGEVYWRSESGGVLVSPCDEHAVAPCLPSAEPAALELLAARLESIAPRWVDAPVRTSWACLRTYAEDRELVLGSDPRVSGLAWLAGLGGRGMTVGLAAGELLGRALRGHDDPLLPRMRPERDGGSSPGR